jgi:hypothetical protein
MYSLFIDYSGLVKCKLSFFAKSSNGKGRGGSSVESLYRAADISGAQF